MAYIYSQLIAAQFENLASDPASTASGLVYFNTTSNVSKYYNGSAWKTFLAADFSNVTGTLAVANGGTGVTSSTGTGSVVLSNSPTLVTPALGTPSSATLTNATGLPIDGGTTGTLPISRGGTGVTSSTGTGSVVLSNSPTLVTPALGTPASGTLTNATGLPIDGGTTGTLPISRGGTGQTSQTNAFDALAPTTTNGDLIYHNGTDNVRLPIGTDGQALTVSGGSPSWAAVTPTLDSPADQLNLSLLASVSSNALTIAVKDKSGSDPSSGSPVKIAFRNATSTNGTYSVVSISSALSLTISSGSTLGHASGVSYPIYIYLMNNSGTAVLGASTSLFDDFSVQSSTAEGGAGAADSAAVIYSASAQTNVPVKLIGRLISSQSTAGTWASAPTETAVGSRLLHGKNAKSSIIIPATSSPVTMDVNSGFSDVVIDASGASRTLNLPPVATSYGRMISVMRSDASTSNTATIDANASETINGSLTYLLYGQYSSVRLFCDGTQWIKVSESWGSYGKWQSFTLSSPNSSFSSFTTSDAVWRRNGPMIEIKANWASVTTSGSEAQISLPASLTTITNSVEGGDNKLAGTYFRLTTGGGSWGGAVLYQRNVGYFNFGTPDAFSSAASGDATWFNPTTGNGTGLSAGCKLAATIPINQFNQ